MRQIQHSKPKQTEIRCARTPSRRRQRVLFWQRNVLDSKTWHKWPNEGREEREDVCMAKAGRNGLYDQGESPPEFVILQFKLWKKFSVVWLTSAVQPSEPERLMMLTWVVFRLLKYGTENVCGRAENPNIFWGGAVYWYNKNSTYILKYWKL